MELLRVFNNNVVLARDAAGREVVLTGRGLGFQARTGQAVDMTKVVRTFVPDAGRNADNVAQLLASIPPEHIDLAALALDEVRADLDRELPSSTVVALADHLSFAIKRTGIWLAASLLVWFAWPSYSEKLAFWKHMLVYGSVFFAGILGGISYAKAIKK